MRHKIQHHFTRSKPTGEPRIARVERLENRRLLSAGGVVAAAAHTPVAKHHVRVALHPAKKSSDGGGSDSGKSHGHGKSDNSGGGSSDGSDDGDGSGSSSGSGSGSGSGSSENTDHIPPSSAISASDVTQVSTGSEQVMVVFTDDHAIDASGVGASDLKVNGPANLSVASVAVSQNGSTSVTAVFTIATPAGGWVAADNGYYALSLASGAAMDASGNPSVTASGAFQVNLPKPAGSVDSSFGSGVTINAPFVAEAVAAQPDGKLLVAGHQGDIATGQSQGIIERLNSDGSIDSTFGAGGKVATAAGNNDAFFDVIVQPDGRFVVAGSSSGGAGTSDFLIQRFDALGKADSSFGKAARTVTDFGGTTAVAYAATFTSNGGLVVAGSSDGRFAFAAYDARGTLDSAFGQGGRQLFALGTGSEAIGAIVTTPGGQILAAGGSGTNVVLLRLTGSGVADPTFAGGGVITVPQLATRQQPGAIDHAEGLAIDATGRILVAGGTSSGHFGVARLSSLGVLDTTFGSAGLATANFGGSDHADQVLIGGSGQILVLGTSTLAGVTNTTVAAFDLTGSPILSFGNAGQLVISPNTGMVQRELHISDLVLHAFGVLQDGKLVVGSSSTPAASTPSATPSTTTLLRILIAQQLDSPSPTAKQNLGMAGGKQQSAVFALPGGAKATFTLQGGSGTAMLVGSRVRLLINADSKGASLAVRISGGDGRVTMDDVTINGSLHAFKCANADLAGTLYASGSIGTVALGQVVGTIASGAGAIGTISATLLSGAHILSGANLGADGRLGGSGTNADTFVAGAIGSVRVNGTVATSVIAAGDDPMDGIFLNGNDKQLGGKTSVIRSILIQGGVDAKTRFVAGMIQTGRIPQRIVPAKDVHFAIVSG